MISTGTNSTDWRRRMSVGIGAPQVWRTTPRLVVVGIQGLREDLILSSKTRVVWPHSLRQTSAILLV